MLFINELLPQTRIHPLPTFSTDKQKVWVKREDEASFGISGGKMRKYASVLAFLEREKIEEVYIIGGANSNNVVGLLQVLNERKIPAWVYVKESNLTEAKGNAFLLKLLAKPVQIRWQSRDYTTEDLVKIAQNDLTLSAKKGYLLPEGASCAPAVYGLTSLLEDIERNEKETLHAAFDHIFIDSGTGLTAATLAYCLQMAGRNTQLHCVHIAGNEQEFEQQLEIVKKAVKSSEPLKTLNSHHYSPATAKSFGSVNSTIKQEIYRLAQEEGLLCDPIYSAKFFYTARKILQTTDIEGNILLIHSGGGTGLMGFYQIL